jgi:hypothetical protein
MSESATQRHIRQWLELVAGAEALLNGGGAKIESAGEVTLLTLGAEVVAPISITPLERSIKRFVCSQGVCAAPTPFS